MKIAVPMFMREKDRKVMEEAAPGAEFCYGKDLDTLQGAEVIIGNVAPKKLAGLAGLKWVQLNSAGADAYCKPGILDPSVQLTNCTGAYGQALSEHMLALTLSLQKKLYLYHRNQLQHQWKDEGEVTSLEGATVVVVGFGDIGRSYGRLCRLLGAHVIGIRRHRGEIPTEADQMGTLEDLPGFLGQADVVASVLPGTPETTHLYDAGMFQAMKPGAFFINCGRGNAVVQEDLARALSEGHLAGAALDVTDPEPLPADSPLWDVHNLLITPHISGDHHLPQTWDKAVAIAARNLKHYLAGEPLENVVDRKTGYKKSV